MQVTVTPFTGRRHLLSALLRGRRQRETATEITSNTAGSIPAALTLIFDNTKTESSGR
jgi:hypothetical protein